MVWRVFEHMRSGAIFHGTIPGYALHSLWPYIRRTCWCAGNGNRHTISTYFYIFDRLVLMRASSSRIVSKSKQKMRTKFFSVVPGKKIVATRIHIIAVILNIWNHYNLRHYLGSHLARKMMKFTEFFVTPTPIPGPPTRCITVINARISRLSKRTLLSAFLLTRVDMMIININAKSYLSMLTKCRA